MHECSVFCLSNTSRYIYVSFSENERVIYFEEILEIIRLEKVAPTRKYSVDKLLFRTPYGETICFSSPFMLAERRLFPTRDPQPFRTLRSRRFLVWRVTCDGEKIIL